MKFKFVAYQTTYYEAVIEADSEKEARELFEDMSVGDMDEVGEIVFGLEDIEEIEDEEDE